MASAIALFGMGVRDILLIERNNSLGGILNQCIHTGFGLSYYKEELTGPEYSMRMSRRFLDLGIPYQTDAMVIGMEGDKVLTITSECHGLQQIKAKAVILATGCRERTREAIEVAGSRPAGVFTAGQAQNLINLRHLRIGKKVIIQGSGDIGLIMARRLQLEGYEVIKVFERLPFLSGLIRNKIQCLDDYGIPLEFGAQITSINGRKRVESVDMVSLDSEFRPIAGSEKRYACDTVIFSVGLIQEMELGRSAGIAFSGQVPSINSKFETSVPGLFVAGNALHIHDLADGASLEGEIVAKSASLYLEDRERFRSEAKAEIPYRALEPDQGHDAAFFDRLREKGQIVCIVCPKGCLLSPDDYGCKRGKEHFLQERHGKKRILTTTIVAEYQNVERTLTVRSKDPLPFDALVPVKDMLRKIGKMDSLDFSVDSGGTRIEFAAVPLS